MSDKREREKIRDPMKRAVRQRCGFGCVVCGTPIFEYHHMTPWSIVQCHEEENLTLLCDLHHKEATGNQPLLTDKQVRRANSQPHNLRAGSSKPHWLHFEGPNCHVSMGTNRITGLAASDFAAVVIDGYPLLGFRYEDGIYMLNFRYYSPENDLLLSIIDNEISYTAGLWDIHWTANRLVIRAKLRDVVLDIEFQTPDTVTIHKGILHLNGVKVEVAPHYLNVGNRQWLSGCTVKGNVGIHAGHDQHHVIVGGGMVADSPDRLPGFEHADSSQCRLCFPSRETQENQNPTPF